VTFLERLDAAVERSGSLLCIGLDPHGAGSAAAALDACRACIEATLPWACAYKPNLAFFERFGAAGYAAAESLRASVPSDRVYIVDAKRGDIGSTSEAYARALYDVLGADAVTVNPLLGRDAVQPFLDRGDRGVFLLARSSNPGAADFMDQELRGGGRLYERIVTAGVGWDPGGRVGFVVGATSPAAIRRVRLLAPDAALLLPGVGAQGADVAEAVRAGVDSQRRRALIVSGRGILSAATGPAVAAAALSAAVQAARQTAAVA
jgi:orotidine 5'-phosphate decarboxylase subfamily 2